MGKKIEEERKNSIYTDQTFMEKLHTHGDKIGQHNITSNIINLCVIQWYHNRKIFNALGRIQIHQLGPSLVNYNCGKTPLETH